jgi:hypothetical protein
MKYLIKAKTPWGDLEITEYFDTEDEAQKELDDAFGFTE